MIVLVLLAALLVPALSQKLEVTHWQAESEKLDSNLRLAVVSDLHNSFFGEGQAELIAAIDAAAPDAVLMAGDMADGLDSMDGVCALAAGLAAYPLYYVSGNHEAASPGLWQIKERLRSLGVTVLEGEAVQLREDVFIAGLDDPKLLRLSEWRAAIEACRVEGDAFTLLLSHRPFRMDFYKDFDLTVCGHAHGGQIRLFGRGLWAPDEGFFPEYTSGLYAIGEGEMFVSRGLAKGVLPRFLNRPELAIIDVLAK